MPHSPDESLCSNACRHVGRALLACMAFLLLFDAARADGLRVGFGKADITPDVHSRRGVWLAGFMPGRRATGVHDPLYARALVLRAGRESVAVVSLDLMGWMYPEVLAIRRQLSEFTYVLVASTHNHAAPDAIGLWGPTPFLSGVDPAYTRQVIDGAVAAVRQADRTVAHATARFGVAIDESLLHDSRLPLVRDGVLRVVEFRKPASTSRAGLLVQWNCHPEALDETNTEITADFCAATVAALQERYACPVVYVSGAVGGLMAPPQNLLKNPDGTLPAENSFEFSALYGKHVAELARKAIEAAEPIELTPLHASSRTISVPVTNPLYRIAGSFHLTHRELYVWTGKPREQGPPWGMPTRSRPAALRTEVGCLRWGQLYVAMLPGELYPELVYGQFQEPPEKDADFPDAPREPHVAGILRDKKFLLVGLANDEIGYLIPKRQWDSRPPYAYRRKSSQYGEINSVGPDATPLVMHALAEAVDGLQPSRP